MAHTSRSKEAWPPPPQTPEQHVVVDVAYKVTVHKVLKLPYDKVDNVMGSDVMNRLTK